jgi:rhodanese-related sulfurtransferase
MRLVLVSLLFVVGCATAAETPDEPKAEAPAEPEAEEPSFTLEAPDVVREKIANGALIVDVRPAKWFNEAHVAGANNLFWKEWESRASEFEAWTGGDKSKPVVLYCGNGSMAAKIRDQLKAQGYTDVSAQAYGAVKELVPAPAEESPAASAPPEG